MEASDQIFLEFINCVRQNTLLSELDKNNICNQLLSPRRVGVSRTGPRTNSADYRRAASLPPLSVDSGLANKQS